MTITALTDTELLEQARAGDEAAFTELYVRHQPAALRLARSYRRMGDPDDLVNGAFERVLGALRRGTGPTESFRAYLFVTLRRLASEQGERPADESIDDVPEPINEAAAAGELDMADREIITRAFESLPDRWQAVLWHTAVEGRQPRELADVLGVTANAAAAMSYRAREKLRQSYLQAHLLADPAPDHEPWRSQLGAYVRDGLSSRDRTAVDAHLEGCSTCRALLVELQDVNRSLARAVLPLFLLVGGGKLAAGAAAGGAAAGAAGADKGLFAKLKHLAPTVGSTAAIAAVVGGLVGMGTAVSREDGRPLNSADDAADIGGSGPLADQWGGGGDDDEGGGAGDSDSLFGDEDFALSPFDEGTGEFDDFGDSFDLNDEFSDFDDDFGDDFDFGDEFDDDEVAGPLPRSGPRSRPNDGTPRPSRPSTQSPSPAPPPRPSVPNPPPRPNPPPVNPPPTTTPPPVEPADLTLAGSTWAPAPAGTGTLSLTIGEAGADAAATITPLAVSGARQPSSLVLDVKLDGGAQFSREGQPAGCTPNGANITCTFQQPAAGGSASFDLVVNQASQAQTATLTILRGGAAEGEPLTLPLPRYGDGLDLSPIATRDLLTPDGTVAPGVLATFGVTNTEAHEVETAVVTIDVTSTVPGATPVPDAAFVPPGSNVDAAVRAIEARLTARQWPQGSGDAFRSALASPLPDACTTTATAPTDWDLALRTGGLPSEITCTVGPIPAGGTVTLDGVLLLVHPAVWDGDGFEDPGTVTATLSLPDGTEVGTAQTLTLTPFRPPAGGVAAVDPQAGTG